MKRAIAVLMLLMAGVPGFAWSQGAWPSKPVRMVLPFAAGGAADGVARITADGLTSRLGQPVLVENRPGAGQNIGTATVVKSPADGYTMLLVSEVIAVEHLLDPTVGFVVQRDLAAVARVAGAGLMVIVPADFPAKTMQELSDTVKANPGKYNYANVNNFELPELVDLRDRLGWKVVTVPYKSGVAAHQAVATGESHMFVGAPTDAITFSQSGKIRVLAYTGTTPHFLFPNVPTVAASGIGLNDWDAVFSFTTFLPAGTPQDIVTRLHGAVEEVVKNPESAKRFRDLGYQTFITTIPELNALVAARVKRIENMQTRGLKLR